MKWTARHGAHEGELSQTETESWNITEYNFFHVLSVELLDHLEDETILC